MWLALKRTAIEWSNSFAEPSGEGHQPITMIGWRIKNYMEVYYPKTQDHDSSNYLNPLSAHDTR